MYQSCYNLIKILVTISFKGINELGKFLYTLNNLAKCVGCVFLSWWLCTVIRHILLNFAEKNKMML